MKVTTYSDLHLPPYLHNKWKLSISSPRTSLRILFQKFFSSQVHWAGSGVLCNRRAKPGASMKHFSNPVSLASVARPFTETLVPIIRAPPAPVEHLLFGFRAGWLAWETAYTYSHAATGRLLSRQRCTKSCRAHLSLDAYAYLHLYIVPGPCLIFLLRGPNEGETGPANVPCRDDLNATVRERP